MHDQPTDLATLRRSPSEWRRRGLTPPDMIATMVRNRIDGGTLRLLGGAAVGEPSYADFFEGVA